MTPAFSITSQGKDYSASYSDILIDLTITDQSDENADTFNLTLSDVGNAIELPEEGKQIEIAVGTDGALTKAGIFVVDEVSLSGPPDQIQLSGKAAAFTDAGGWSAMQARRSRSWDEITLGDVVKGIAGEHGMEAAVSPSLAAIQIPHLDQTSESNLNLLTRLARTYGAIFKPSFGRLVFAAGNGDAVTGAVMQAITITRGPGMIYTAKLSRRTTFSKVKARHHDNETGETSTVLAQADPEITAEAEKIYEIINDFPDEATATAAAQATLNNMDRGSKTVSLDLPGLWYAVAEQRITLAGWRSQMNGDWIAKKVEISLSKSAGLRTKIDLETPGAAAAAKEKATVGSSSDAFGTSDPLLSAEIKQAYDAIK